MAWRSIGNCYIFTIFVHSHLDVFTISVRLGRAFHHFREARDEKEAVKKHPELDRLLREEYRGMEDFKRTRANKAAVKEDSH